MIGRREEGGKTRERKEKVSGEEVTRVVGTKERREKRGGEREGREGETRAVRKSVSALRCFLGKIWKDMCNRGKEKVMVRVMIPGAGK